MFVSNHMTPNPVTITSGTNIADAAHVMRKNKFRRLPVVDDGKLVGIITDRDLREVSPSAATSLSIYEINYLLAKMKVKDVMKKELVTVRADATVEEAALLMYNNKIGGIIVVNEAGAPVGIITETDIFKCFVDVMGLPQGKTRITLDMADKVGAVHEITAVFADLGINIGSMVSHGLVEGKAEMVIRADIPDITVLSARLEEKGYPVRHVVQIG